MTDRRLLPLLVALALPLMSACGPSGPDPAVCHGGRLGTAEARERAMTDGYEIDPANDCITRVSWEAIQAQERANQVARAARAAEQAQRAEAARSEASQSLAEARARVGTQLHLGQAGTPFPTPPAKLFVRHDYTSAGQQLAAYVSPDPGDGAQHPAILWLTGGDSNTLDDFWTPGPASNDQSASAYREAGVLMMFPTLRGGNQNPGERELFYGEVDDVIAAGRELARLPYVDPQQIYLGGHSTGGTLALLVAETENPFRAVFAFGPAGDITGYGPSLVPADMSRQEARLRSPLYWLHSLQQATFVIEGERGNRAAQQSLCREPRSSALHCLTLPDHDHFSVLDAVNRRIAAQLFLGDPSLLTLEAITP